MSDEHICKPKDYSKEGEALSTRYNPMSTEPDVNIPCGICRSYSCCSPDEHGVTDFYSVILEWVKKL